MGREGLGLVLFRLVGCLLGARSEFRFFKQALHGSSVVD